MSEQIAGNQEEHNQTIGMINRYGMLTPRQCLQVDGVDNHTMMPYNRQHGYSLDNVDFVKIYALPSFHFFLLIYDSVINKYSRVQQPGRDDRCFRQHSDTVHRTSYEDVSSDFFYRRRSPLV